MCGNEGYILVRGVNEPNANADSDDEEPREKRSPDSYTEEEMARMRVIIGTPQRKRYKTAMRMLLLGDESSADMMFLSFDTSFSYAVEGVLHQMVPQLEKRLKEDPAKAFDMLLALTLTLDEFDVWMHDHEVEFLGTAPKLLGRLAKLWKGALAKSDAALGIDTEFTRLGVHAMLEGFQRNIERIDTCGFAPPLKFKWK